MSSDLKDLLDEISEEIHTILDEKFEIEETETVPEVADLSYDNKGKLLETAVLYIDIRDSTDLTDEHTRETSAKIYKSFLNSMVNVAKFGKGKVRSFAGDRLMLLFDNTTSDDPIYQAVNTALVMQAVVEDILSPMVKSKYGREIHCGLGIDYDGMLVARVGSPRIREFNDLIWAGNAANLASKLTDSEFSSSGEIVITERVFEKMPANLYPEHWIKSQMSLGGKIITIYKLQIQNIQLKF